MANIRSVNIIHTTKNLNAIRNAKWRRKNQAKCLYYQAKRRAQKTGVYFNIKPEDIKIPKRCPVLGILLYSRIYDGINSVIDNSPTVDRVDMNLGYIPGNVRVISYRANTIKSNGSIIEHLKIILYILRHKVARVLWK